MEEWRYGYLPAAGVLLKSLIDGGFHGQQSATAFAEENALFDLPANIAGMIEGRCIHHNCTSGI